MSESKNSEIVLEEKVIFKNITFKKRKNLTNIFTKNLNCLQNIHYNELIMNSN